MGPTKKTVPEQTSSNLCCATGAAEEVKTSNPCAAENQYPRFTPDAFIQAWRNFRVQDEDK